ncbi:hypothetical protein MNB_SM-5-1480 [hydrothermal vent metagenome]|uniref:Prepilin-type N-terminal cleavage/methylation domain-containing protein n=1 Tax=hydrothermal vent metagenome TaxID=652676 RepID=A0A1W1CY43_9ZZZZ
MTKQTKRGAFTLIEVMVAVMIISVVILALMRMYANDTYLFATYKKESHVNDYASFLIENSDFGLENKNIYLYDLVSEFDMEDNLRRKLKEQKAEVIYKVVKNIDLSDDTNTTAPQMSLEIGESVIRLDKGASTALSRLQLR